MLAYCLSMHAAQLFAGVTKEVDCLKNSSQKEPAAYTLLHLLLSLARAAVLLANLTGIGRHCNIVLSAAVTWVGVHLAADTCNNLFHFAFCP